MYPYKIQQTENTSSIISGQQLIYLAMLYDYMGIWQREEQGNS